MRTSGSFVWLAALAILAAGCAGSLTNDADAPGGPQNGASSTLDGDAATASLAAQIETIDAAIVAWRAAASVEEAQSAAETAANLVVGPNGPGYGDRDGNGDVSGRTDVGLLPGLDGTPAGLASAVGSNECVFADVLGGAWADPVARWDEMVSAIERWRPDNNTMPSLASHPMRIVGWATFSMASSSLDEIQSFGGHANIHVKVSQRALDC